MFAGATIPTPLYPVYQQAFGFSEITLTLIYAVYVLGNMAALLILGRLSDQIGRRKVTVPAIGFGIVTTLVFTSATSTSWLFAARVLSGFATGLAAGAATAWIGELLPNSQKKVAAPIATAANFIGLAVGPLLAGVLAQFAFWPLQLSYLVYLALLTAIGAAIFLVPETVKNPTRLLRDVSLRPRLGVPKQIRVAFLSPAVTAFVTFALIGFYAALIPSLLRESLHQTTPVVAGTVVFLLFLAATLIVVVTGKLSGQTAVLWGLVLLPPSLGLLLTAEVVKSTLILLLASALSGVSGALGYRGSLEVVGRIAPINQRSEVISTNFVAVFAGNALPVIGIGLLSSFAGSMPAHLVFGIIVTGLAVAALVNDAKHAPPQ